VASESSKPEAILTLKLKTESGDLVLLPLSERTTRQLQQVISEFNRTRDLLFVAERPSAPIGGPMLSERCPLKVVRTNGGDEVLARASNLLIGRAALETAKRMYPRDLIEQAPNPPPSSQVNTDAAAASLRRHVLPKDLPAAIKQLGDQELDRLQVAVLAEQKRRGRKPAVSVQAPDKPREVAAVHLTPGKMNAVRAAFKAGVKPSQIARLFGLSQSDVRKVLASDA
jgi:hypothetical protein